MYRFFAALTLLALALCVDSDAFSSGRNRGVDRGQEKLEIITMWKMMEALDLDKETADKIFDIRRKYLEKKRELRNDLQADFRKLRDLLSESSETVAEGTLKQLLTTIREKRKKLQSLWGEQYDEVSKVLSVRRQAQLMLFLKDFRKEIQSLLRPRGLGPPRGPGSGRWRNRPHPPNRRPWEKREDRDDFPEGR